MVHSFLVTPSVIFALGSEASLINGVSFLAALYTTFKVDIAFLKILGLNILLGLELYYVARMILRKKNSEVGKDFSINS